MVTFVLLLLSALLVLVGLVTLIVGVFIADSLTWVYVSIGSTVAAGVVLYILNRLTRRGAAEQARTELAASPAAANVPPAAPIVTGPPAGPAQAEAEAATAIAAPVSAISEVAIFPIDEYDDLRVAEIIPLLSELDPDELQVVRQREQSGKNRATIVTRIDLLAGGPAPVAASAWADADEGFGLPDVDVDFPIADYEDLKMAELLPLLDELDADELEVVAEHEERGANRKTVMTRITYRLTALEGAPMAELVERPAAPRGPARKKAPAAAKTTAPSRPAKKTAPKAAPARKVAPRTATAKKAAPVSRAAPVKTVAKKATAATAGTAVAGRRAAKKTARPAAPARTAVAPARKSPPARKAAAPPTRKAAPARKAVAPAPKAAPARKVAAPTRKVAPARKAAKRGR